MVLDPQGDLSCLADSGLWYNAHDRST